MSSLPFIYSFIYLCQYGLVDLYNLSYGSLRIVL